MDGSMLLLAVFAVVRSISRGSAGGRDTKDENDDGGYGDVDPKSPKVDGEASYGNGIESILFAHRPSLPPLKLD
jgi:hypothetical protein